MGIWIYTNRPAPVACALTVLTSACTGSPRGDADARAPAESSSTPPVQEYRCDSGATIRASYPSADLADVRYEGTVSRMGIAVSGSGARYVGDGLEWWTKGSGGGSEGLLFRHPPDGSSGELLESCSGSDEVPLRRAD